GLLGAQAAQDVVEQVGVVERLAFGEFAVEHAVEAALDGVHREGVDVEDAADGGVVLPAEADLQAEAGFGEEDGAAGPRGREEAGPVVPGVPFQDGVARLRLAPEDIEGAVAEIAAADVAPEVDELRWDLDAEGGREDHGGLVGV